MHSGLASGGFITINAEDSNKYDISPGVGYIVDNSNPLTPIIKKITFNAQIGLSLQNPLGRPASVVTINQNEQVLEKTRQDLPAIFRTDIILGIIIHPGGTILSISNVVFNGVVYGSATAYDLCFALKSINVRGNKITPNGPNLKLNRSAGEVFSAGVNFKTVPNNPNQIMLPAETALPWLYVWRNGSGGFNFLFNSDIIPGAYDDGTGGVLQPNGVVIPGGWSVQRIYLIPGTLVIHYGQDTYMSLSDAVDGIFLEDFSGAPDLDGAVFLGWILLRGNCSNLQDSISARIIKPNKFGGPSII